jgi:hypothetical protein
MNTLLLPPFGGLLIRCTPSQGRPAIDAIGYRGAPTPLMLSGRIYNGWSDRTDRVPVNGKMANIGCVLRHDLFERGFFPSWLVITNSNS